MATYVATVSVMDDWPAALAITSERLVLEPLRVDHADEVAPLFADPRLHTFIGGHPATVEELRGRYERQVVGHSDDGTERWLNWILRHLESGAAVGTVQATITTQGKRIVAEVAWVTAWEYQSRGYASEAARVMAAWLRRQGVEVLIAHVHPEHEASKAVARRIGLTPTGEVVEGEVAWAG